MTALQTPLDRPLGDALDILGSYQRRFVLARVSEADGAVSLSELATDLTADRQDVSPTAVTESERKRTEIRLHHVEIPPLSAAGLISYDQQRSVVHGEDLPLEGSDWLEMPVVEALEAWNR